MPPSRNSRHSTTRQESCQQCSAARARCDRKKTCGRCDSRGLTCTYSTTRSRDTSTPSENTAEILMPTYSEELQMQNSTNHQINEHQQNMAEFVLDVTPEPDPRADVYPDLICSINPDDIQIRWLNANVPLPGQEAKSYPQLIKRLIPQTLKAYALKAIQGHAPPFIYPGHMSFSPLSTCFSLIRLCNDPLPRSERVVVEILQREMARLYSEYTTYNDKGLFSTFQACLLYSMVLFFQLTPASKPFLRQAMINLQEIARATSRQGLASTFEESSRCYPVLGEWHFVEAKRRTVYTMYLLDEALSIADGFPMFIAQELEGLYAPSSKELWQARSAAEWAESISDHRADWGTRSFQVEELWPVSPEADCDDIEERQERTDCWCKDADEFGWMFYNVTTCANES